MSTPAKKMKMESNEDRISQLPYDILAIILSLLPSEQSARTSTLAKVWKNIWKLSVKHVCIIYPSFTYQFLKNLSILDKKVDRLNVQDILSNCTVLEEFRLVRSESVQVLTVSGKSLKKLEIVGCCHLQKLELFAPKLLFFKYNGPDTEFVFGDVPRLVEVSFVGLYCIFIVRRKFKQFEPILEQLERINLIQDFTWIDEFPRVDGFKNIKKVRLDIKIWDYQRPLRLFVSIIQALPSLEVFSLRLYWPSHHEEITDLSNLNFEDHQKHGLRVFKMDGFMSAGFELTFIDYVVERAVSLEKVVLRLSKRVSVESDEDQMDIMLRESVMFDVDDYIDSLVHWPTRLVLL